MFNVTSRFQDAVGLMNGVPADKFKLVLSRVMDGLVREARNTHATPASVANGSAPSGAAAAAAGTVAGQPHHRHNTMFTAQERQKLESMTQLSDKDISTLLDACSYVLEQCAYHNASVKAVGENLIAVEMEENIARAYCAVWKQHREQFITALKSKSTALGAPATLEQVQFRVQVGLEHSRAEKTKDLSAVLSLMLHSQNSGPKTKESISFQMDETELTQLYEKLEVVQAQLDTLVK